MEIHVYVIYLPYSADTYKVFIWKHPRSMPQTFLKRRSLHVCRAVTLFFYFLVVHLALGQMSAQRTKSLELDPAFGSGVF